MTPNRMPEANWIGPGRERREGEGQRLDADENQRTPQAGAGDHELQFGETDCIYQPV